MAINRRRRTFFKRVAVAFSLLVVGLIFVSVLVGSTAPFYVAAIVLGILFAGFLLREAFLDARDHGDSILIAAIKAPARVVWAWLRP